MAQSLTGAVLVIGGGRMGEALAAGLRGQGWPDRQLVIVEALPDRRQTLAGNGLVAVGTIKEGLDRLEGEDIGAVIAVKPYDVEGVARELAAAGVGRVLSIAAGVTLDDLDRWLDPAVAVRAMPNTPALVGCAASAVAGGRRATGADVEWAKRILSAVGTVVELGEPSLDAVTGLSGSGPAYVFLLAEALIDAGVLVGLTRQVAQALAVQTLLGAAQLMAETGEEPSALRAAVTSPGGTTAAALRELERAGLRSAILEAVVAAAERSRELGRH
ncbi:MAG TPA: pyrroline-5-carboxylate reductase [Acidimicrobiales bacterium]|nr:pyrroline-5-carboxylate reductase [Acidimicrobiales bacterium]